MRKRDHLTFSFCFLINSTHQNWENLRKAWKAYSLCANTLHLTIVHPAVSRIAFREEALGTCTNTIHHEVHYLSTAFLSICRRCIAFPSGVDNAMVTILGRLAVIIIRYRRSKKRVQWKNRNALPIFLITLILSNYRIIINPFTTYVAYVHKKKTTNV